MGKSMASHLLEAGYPVLVYNRTKSKTDELIQRGAVWKDSVPELSREAGVIITMLGYPQDVEETYLGEDGILKHAKSGTYVIDMTTSTPSLAVKIAEQARERGISAMDAPVSGGDVGAREARLTIMVGGDEEAFEQMSEILSKMGQNIVHQGPAGSGHHTKMCNQIAIASNMMGICESMAYAEAAGLDPNKVLSSIQAGAAGSWSLSNLASRMLRGDFAPGFFVKHFIKDMTIALAEAQNLKLLTPGLQLAKELYEELAQMGEAESGTQALYKLYKEQIGRQYID